MSTTMISTRRYCRTATIRWSAPRSRAIAVIPEAPPAIMLKAPVTGLIPFCSRSSWPAPRLSSSVPTVTSSTGSQCSPMAPSVSSRISAPMVTPITACAAVMATRETSNRVRPASARTRPASRPPNRAAEGTCARSRRSPATTPPATTAAASSSRRRPSFTLVTLPHCRDGGRACWNGRRTATAVEEAGATPARSRHCEPAPAGQPGTPAVASCHLRAWTPGERTSGLPVTYPFGAVVGMDDMRLALLLNAVSPAIGGVLVRGEKGTAKSTTVRALAAVLPPVDVVAGCRFACDPAAPDPACPDGPHDPGAPSRTRPARLVELPVGASEDRVVGALDLERALTEGVKSFEPGLLAAAHRGVLYVDEVNLLHDHLVDLLLDAAALGTAYVEREGVSVRHAARFLLVGTMNPEEGELRPQLLDRFGLTVEVAAPRDADLRAEVVRRRFAHDADPAAFTAVWAAGEAVLAAQIADARARLPRVVLSDAALRQVTSVCAAFDVDGLRADLVTARAAIAHAAWCGRDEVTEDDVRVAARLALPHRRRRNPFDAPGLDDDALEQALSDARPDDDPEDDGPGPDDGGSPPQPDGAGGAQE